MKNPSSLLADISNDMFAFLANTYPISCASDEFFYFPQIRLSELPWNIWDNFSSDSTVDSARLLATWEDKLAQLPLSCMDLQEQIDVYLLIKYARTLNEQLSEVRSWESQPSFYLTLACIGLAEAIESEDPAAKYERARTLPLFFDQASRNLVEVPILFRDIGLEMVRDTRRYFSLLIKIIPEISSALDALGRFEDRLKRVDIRQNFQLEKGILERVVDFHIGSNKKISAIQMELDLEIEEMRKVVKREAKKNEALVFDHKSTRHTWLDVYNCIPGPSVDKDSIISIFKSEVDKIAEHCLHHGLVKQSLLSSCPVIVEMMPDFLSAIRAGASYSIPPQYPPKSGKFYLYTKNITDKLTPEALREYRMTCAHETYPGHHLLDASRWGMNRLLRRATEQPIFYEGWACFAEELMRSTGYFASEVDGLILARRRFSHAIRAKVDIGLQTGTMDLSSAADYLEGAGIKRDRAEFLAQKYTLNPGYQLCYTLGLRRFLDLFSRYGRSDPPAFVHTVLNQGEIGFSYLEKVLQLQ